MNFIIKYRVINALDETLSEGAMRVKNKDNGVEACNALENYLKSKIPHFNKMILVGIKIDKEKPQYKQPQSINTDPVDFLKNIFGMD